VQQVKEEINEHLFELEVLPVEENCDDSRLQWSVRATQGPKARRAAARDDRMPEKRRRQQALQEGRNQRDQADVPRERRTGCISSYGGTEGRDAQMHGQFPTSRPE